MNNKKVLIKLSGEALANKNDSTILDANKLKGIANEIKSIIDHNPGIEISIVVGAGNIWRGALATSIGIERSTADYMGMLGTIINALALQSSFQNVGIDTRVMSSIEVPAVAEPYLRKRAIRHLEKGRLVIFAGGTGNPYFTTDTTATLRAMEVGVSMILMAKNGVDGVYSDDPRINKDAKLLKNLTFKELIDQDLKVMDQTAISLIIDKDIVVHVFEMKEGNMEKIIDGQDVGTTIRKV